MNKHIDAVIKIIHSENRSIDFMDERTYNEDLNILGLDSLDFMVVILKVQEKFNIDIPESELENIKSLLDLEKIIENLQVKNEELNA